MAYKYQLGDARMSGSLIQEGGVTTEASGDLTIAGSSDLNGALDVAGQVDLAASGVSTSIRGGLTVDEASLFSAVVQFDGTVDCNSTSNFEGNAVFQNQLTASHMSASTIQCTTLTAAAETIIIGTATFSQSNVEAVTGITAGTIAAGKAVIVDSNKDASSFRYVTAEAFIGTVRQSINLKDNGDTLDLGINYFADLGGAESVSLPASPSAGDSVRLKAPSNCSSTNTLTINRQGSHTIDGETSVVLESPFAAVEFVYVATNLWRIF